MDVTESLFSHRGNRQNPNFISSFPRRYILISPIMAGLLDLETQFAFYGAYHSAPLNILIHAIFVWPIFFTGLLFLYFTPPIVQIAIPFELPLVLNFGFVFALAYAVYYFCLDRRAGSAGALLCFLCWIGSSFLGNRLGRQRSFQVYFSPS